VSLTAFVGYTGTLLYLVSHAYVSLKPAFNPRYYFSGNLVAATALVVSSSALFSWQAVCTNLFWALVSLQRLRGAPMPASVMLKAHFQRFSRVLVIALLILLVISVWVQPLLAISLLAWSSVAIFSVVYLLFAAGELDKKHYMWLNFAAAIIIMPQLWLDLNFPVLLLESCWAIVSLYGALRSNRATQLI